MNHKVTMTALDTFHASNVHSENLQEGHVFLVGEADAKALEVRGLAKRGGKAAEAVNAPANRRPGRHPETREEIEAERQTLKSGRANKGRSRANKSPAIKPISGARR